MIIKFGKFIKLDSWYYCSDSTSEIIWYRKLIPYEDYDSVIMVSIRAYDTKYCYANFYSQLSFLHKYFPSKFEGNLDLAKNYVDNFLIKMNRLAVFV